MVVSAEKVNIETEILNLKYTLHGTKVVALCSLLLSF